MAIPFVSPRPRFFDNSGVPLAGGRVYFYVAGTSTPKATYTDADATVANTHPVILDTFGEALIHLSGEYKVVLKDANDVTLWTFDGLKSFEPPVGQWTATQTASYVTATQLSVVGDQTAAFHEGRRLRIFDGAEQFATILASVYNAPDTSVTVLMDGGSVPAALSTVSLGLLSVLDHALPDFVPVGPNAVARSIQSRLNDCVHVRDFGAKGDGVTDDTTAIHAAIQSGATRLLFDDAVYAIQNIVVDRICVLDLQGATLRQITASGDAVKFYNAIAFDQAGIKNGTIEGQATAYAVNHRGLHVENVLHQFICEDLHIKGFGEYGFFTPGNVFGAMIQNLRISQCYDYGFKTSLGTYRFNAAQVNTLKIWNCVQGIDIDNSYACHFYNLWVEDSAGGVGTGTAIRMNNCIATHIHSGYCEWNVGTTKMVDMINATACSINHLLMTSSSASLVQYIELSGSSNRNAIKDCRIKHQTSFAQAITITGVNCVDTVIKGNLMINFISEVSDTGLRSHIEWVQPHIIEMASAFGEAFQAKVSGDSFDRVRLLADGTMQIGDGMTTPDCVLSRGAANLFKTAGDDSFKVGNGLWNGGHLQLGDYHLWVDATGALRIKLNAPSLDTQGSVVGTQV